MRRRGWTVILLLWLPGAMLVGCGSEDVSSSPQRAGSAKGQPPDSKALDAPAFRALLYCAEDEERQSARSAELMELVKKDQSDRREPWAGKSGAELRRILETDRESRSRVGAIFGEGCITSAGDNIRAAMVFQHGYTPEDSFQTYLFAQRALEKARQDEQAIKRRAELLMASGIDRYLVRKGHRQIFGTQLAAVPGSDCLCQEAVEPSFPDALRKELSGRNLEEHLAGRQRYQRNASCETLSCAGDLEPTPRGTVPGLW